MAEAAAAVLALAPPAFAAGAAAALGLSRRGQTSLLLSRRGVLAREFLPIAATAARSEERSASWLKRAAWWRIRGRGAGVTRSATGGEPTAAANVKEEEEGEEEESAEFDIRRLEAYTERVRSEVLCVNALVEADDEDDGEEEQEKHEERVIVFKGFSSSLTRATPDDPSEPLLPPSAVVLGIDRIRGPLKPSNPQYIQRGMTWRDFQRLLRAKGL